MTRLPALGLALLGALAPSAAATPKSIITLAVGDGLAVSGSKIQCGMASDHGYGLPLKGKKYVVCGPSTQVKGGGYIALIDSGDHVYILSIKTHKTVSSRAPQRAHALKTARLGDVIAASGTSIFCDAIKVGGLPTLLCEWVDGKGSVHPNSYAFAVSDSVVSSLRWDAAKQVHILQS